VVAALLDVYVAAFIARCAPMRDLGRPMVDEPGVQGLLPSSADPHARLLMTDDRGYDVLTEVLPDARTGMITVCSAAARCAELLDGHPVWRSATATAMACRDLRALSAPALTDELTLAPVRRLADDPTEGVALTQAVAAAKRADPRITDPDGLAKYLEALPHEFRLFAAVDRAGVARATSGSGVFDATATVIFVNTDPDWRRRGIAQSMAAEALRTAEQSGARLAGLDASEAGKRIYLRLGFKAVTSTTRFRPAN
jgi:GNAT superfamily N-acetyltransferase